MNLPYWEDVPYFSTQVTNTTSCARKASFSGFLPDWIAFLELSKKKMWLVSYPFLPLNVQKALFTEDLKNFLLSKTSLWTILFYIEKPHLNFSSKMINCQHVKSQFRAFSLLCSLTWHFCTCIVQNNWLIKQSFPSLTQNKILLANMSSGSSSLLEQTVSYTNRVKG